MTSSFGFGDRLGSATQAAARAWMKHGPRNGIPVFAQQSARELQATGRTPGQVMESARAGVQAADYRGPWYADADHLTEAWQVMKFAGAGFDWFTLDTSAYADPATTDAAVRWRLAIIKERGLRRKVRALVPSPVIELALDEISRPITIRDHAAILLLLWRYRMKIHVLALRLPGDWQKALDVTGAPNELTLRAHAILARMGGYRLSLHSGSEKWSFYPRFRRATGGHCHVKTSGTAWLVATRVIQAVAPGLYGWMLGTAATAYKNERSRYQHVAGVQPTEGQVLHVCYGPILKAHGDDIRRVLEENRRYYQAALEINYERHLKAVFG